MKKLIISAIIIFASISDVYALKTIRVYPDYTINTIIEVEDNVYYKVKIYLRDNTTKKILSAWNTYDDITNIKLDGSGKIKYFTKVFKQDREEYNYPKAFNFAVESTFRIALIIQDEGLIPQIDFKEFNLTNNSGNMTSFRDFININPTIPSGEWRNVR